MDSFSRFLTFDLQILTSRSSEDLEIRSTRKQPLIEKPVSMASDGQVQISKKKTKVFHTACLDGYSCYMGM